LEATSEMLGLARNASAIKRNWVWGEGLPEVNDDALDELLQRRRTDTLAPARGAEQRDIEQVARTRSIRRIFAGSKRYTKPFLPETHHAVFCSGVLLLLLMLLLMMLLLLLMLLLPVAACLPAAAAAAACCSAPFIFSFF
jgi:hypothetical protein